MPPSSYQPKKDTHIFPGNSSLVELSIHFILFFSWL